MTTPAAESARTAPAVARNREPILAVLQRVLPPRGTVLEIASGSGEHAVYFAAKFPELDWQPTDRDSGALTSIAAHRATAALPNLLPPLQLDAASPSWPATEAAALVAINMIHISPWTSAEGLMAGAERLLAPGGVLFLYGPFMENGRHTAPSNAAFDADLKRRDPAWGVRDLSDVKKLAARHRLDFVERVEMPANNLSVVFVRCAS